MFARYFATKYAVGYTSIDFDAYMRITPGHRVKHESQCVTFLTEDGQVTALCLDVDHATSDQFADTLSAIQSSKILTVVRKSANSAVDDIRFHIVVPISKPVKMDTRQLHESLSELAQAFRVCNYDTHAVGISRKWFISGSAKVYQGTPYAVSSSNSITNNDAFDGLVYEVLDSLYGGYEGSYVDGVYHLVTDCNEHARHGERHDARVSLDLKTGLKSWQCFSAKCSWKGTATTFTPDLVKVARELASRVTIKSFDNVANWWWQFDGDWYNYDEMSRMLSMLLRCDWKMARQAIRNASMLRAESSGGGLRPWDASMVSEARKFWYSTVQINHSNLLVSTEYEAPPGIDVLSNRNWQLSIDGCEFDKLVEIGYGLWPERKLKWRMQSLSPIVAIEALGEMDRKRIITTRQKILATLARGCFVVVLVRDLETVHLLGLDNARLVTPQVLIDSLPRMVL